MQNEKSRRVNHILKRDKIVIFATLIIISFFLLDGLKLITSNIPLANDARAHIFRIIYFYSGITNGDYTPVQYHGYSFVAGYGIFLYMIGCALFKLFELDFSSIASAVYSFDVLFILAPAILSFSAIELANEVKRMSLAKYAVLGIFLISLPMTLPQISVNEALPYIFSFSFSLLALKYMIRLKKGDKNNSTMLLALLFSVMSIYTEAFGYIFTIFNLIFLSPEYKKAAKIILLLIPSTSFSWVQLLQVYGYMSPLADIPQGFIGGYVVSVAIFAAYTAIIRYAKKGFKEDVTYKISFIIILLMGLSIINPLYDVNFGFLNGFFSNIMPYRLLTINFPVLMTLSIFGRLGVDKERILLGMCISIVTLLVASSMASSLLYVPYYARFPQNSSVLSDHNVLIPPPMIYVANSSVIFGPLLDYSTTTGAYSQGDPSFYYLTAYYEWMDAFINNSNSFVNVMQMTGSNAMVAQGNYSFYKGEANFLGYDYGYPVYGINTSLADSVTPIVILSPNRDDGLLFSLFINFLAKNGYSYVFVTHPVEGASGYIILPGYNGALNVVPGTKVIRIINASYSNLVEVNSTYYTLHTPALKEASAIFPDNSYFLYSYADYSYERIPNSSIENATLLADYLNRTFEPVYKPIEYSVGRNSYALQKSALPVLLKVSYYPYFKTNYSLNYTYDVNHLILLPKENGLTLTWHLHFYDLSVIVSILSIILIIINYVRDESHRIEEPWTPA